VTQEGEFLDSADYSYSLKSEMSGFNEQNPRDWIDALKASIGELKNRNAAAVASLQAIGIAGHMHGATLLDKNGEILHPCILWNDTRSYKQASILDQDVKLQEITGNIIFPGFTAPKLLWIQENKPEIFEQVAKVLLPASYLGFYLTGDFFMDMSDAAGTSWLDVGNRCWSDYALNAGNMRSDQMPDLLEGSQIASSVSKFIADELGIPRGVSVVAGAGDNAAAACGVGIMQEGQGFVSLGTSGVLLTARDAYTPLAQSAVHTFCHAIPKTWYQMGVILSATDSLNWLSSVTGKSPIELSESLTQKINGPSSEKFYPYLSGERTPLNDAHIRGGFVGLSTNSNQTKLTQAVMEGVAFALLDCMEVLKKAGPCPDQLLAIGGGSHSRFWLETIAATLNKAIACPIDGEYGAAMGAARLAILGKTSEPVKNILSQPTIAETIEPRSDLTDLYCEAFTTYKKASFHLKSIQ
jgi:xylulokinase